MPRRRSLNKHLRVQVLIRDGYKCRMCGRPADEVPLQVDHILAVANGGTDELANLATLCRDCNAGKSDYTFGNYTEMTIVPDDLASRFEFFHDDRTGDYERYHLYCYFTIREDGAKRDGQFQHTWTITRTALASATDESALMARRREEASQEFLKEIRLALVAERKRLVDQDGDLLKK